MRTQLDKVRLEREIESPTYKLQELKFKMERQRFGLEESKAKLEKQVYRLQQELCETKAFYEERIAQMGLTIRKLESSVSTMSGGDRRVFKTATSNTGGLTGSSIL